MITTQRSNIEADEFFAELKRRKVYRVAIAYAVARFGMTRVQPLMGNVVPNDGVFCE
jgi:hypothetical protein